MRDLILKSTLRFEGKLMMLMMMTMIYILHIDLFQVFYILPDLPVVVVVVRVRLAGVAAGAPETRGEEEWHLRCPDLVVSCLRVSTGKWRLFGK